MVNKYFHSKKSPSFRVKFMFKVGWTPERNDYIKSCLIILSLDRRFRIYKQSGRMWIIAIDLSEILFKYLQSKPTEKTVIASSNCSKQQAKVQNLRNKSYSLATNCWTWTSSSGRKSVFFFF